MMSRNYLQYSEKLLLITIMFAFWFLPIYLNDNSLNG